MPTGCILMLTSFCTFGVLLPLIMHIRTKTISHERTNEECHSLINLLSSSKQS